MEYFSLSAIFIGMGENFWKFTLKLDIKILKREIL